MDGMGVPHTIRFGRPQNIPIYVTINLRARAGWYSTSPDAIRTALVTWSLANQTIGKEVIQSRLFDPINTVPGHSIDSLLIGTAPDPTTSTNIIVPFDGLAVFDASQIVVNVL